MTYFAQYPTGSIMIGGVARVAVHWASSRRKLAGSTGIRDRPWYGPYRVVRAVAEACSAEAFDRLAPEFNRAFKQLWDAAWRSKRRSPLPRGRAGGTILGDPELEAAIGDIIDTADSNPLLRDERYPGPHAAGAKIAKLNRFLDYIRGFSLDEKG
jgi:hypothetical protein